MTKANYRPLQSYFNDREPTLRDEYEFMKETAHRHGTKFTLSFDEWLPIWTALDQSWKRKKSIKLGVLDDRH